MDAHAERGRSIIITIEDAVSIGLLLEGTEQTIYLEILLSLLNGIINNSKDLNYLLSNISENNQDLLMSLIIKRGITPKQTGVLSQDECVFSKWRQC